MLITSGEHKLWMCRQTPRCGLNTLVATYPLGLLPSTVSGPFFFKVNILTSASMSDLHLDGLEVLYNVIALVLQSLFYGEFASRVISAVC